MYYSGWTEGALRSSRQALTRRFVDVRAPGASATLGQSLARLYAARTALLPGDGSSNSRGWFDVGVLAGRRHLANEKWCAVLPARAMWCRGSTDAWAGHSAVLGKGREIAPLWVGRWPSDYSEIWAKPASEQVCRVCACSGGPLA